MFHACNVLDADSGVTIVLQPGSVKHIASMKHEDENVFGIRLHRLCALIVNDFLDMYRMRIQDAQLITYVVVLEIR
jgi:hypothetical protein